MKTFVALFVVSAAFGLSIAVAYWFVAHREKTGTVLLVVMTAALVWSAGYAFLAERDARLDGDEDRLTPATSAGEDLGVFTKGSSWPILVAISAVSALWGLLFAPFVAAVAAVAFILCLWRLGAESART